jgi:hypothetical protein
MILFFTIPRPNYAGIWQDLQGPRDSKSINFNGNL